MQRKKATNIYLYARRRRRRLGWEWSDILSHKSKLTIQVPLVTLMLLNLILIIPLLQPFLQSSFLQKKWNIFWSRKCVTIWWVDGDECRGKLASRAVWCKRWSSSEFAFLHVCKHAQRYCCCYIAHNWKMNEYACLTNSASHQKSALSPSLSLPTTNFGCQLVQTRV